MKRSAHDEWMKQENQKKPKPVEKDSIYLELGEKYSQKHGAKNDLCLISNDSVAKSDLSSGSLHCKRKLDFHDGVTDSNTENAMVDNNANNVESLEMEVSVKDAVIEKEDDECNSPTDETKVQFLEQTPNSLFNEDVKEVEAFVKLTAKRRTKIGLQIGGTKEAEYRRLETLSPKELDEEEAEPKNKKPKLDGIIDPAVKFYRNDNKGPLGKLAKIFKAKYKLLRTRSKRLRARSKRLRARSKRLRRGTTISSHSVIKTAFIMIGEHKQQTTATTLRLCLENSESGRVRVSDLEDVENSVGSSFDEKLHRCLQESTGVVLLLSNSLRDCIDHERVVEVTVNDKNLLLNGTIVNEILQDERQRKKFIPLSSSKDKLPKVLESCDIIDIPDEEVSDILDIPDGKVSDDMIAKAANQIRPLLEGFHHT